MRFFKNLFIGYRAYAKALRLIARHRLYWYTLLPGALMPLVFRLGSALLNREREPDDNTMNGIIWYMAGLLLEISVALMLMRFAKYLVIVLFSPLLAHLSQRTEYLLTGNRYGFNPVQFLNDVKRGIQVAVRNIMWEYFIFLLIFLIAVIGWNPPQASPLFVVIYFTGFFYYGFSMVDYVSERLRLSMKDSVNFMRAHRGLAIAIGSVYSVLIWIPLDFSAVIEWGNFGKAPVDFLIAFFKNVLIWACAAFAPVWAIVAATIGMNDIVGLKNNLYAESDNVNN